MKKTTLNILSFFVIAVLLVFSFASCKSSKQCDSSYNNETRNDNLSAEYNNETRNDNLSAEPPSSSTPSESSDNGTETETNKPEAPDIPPAAAYNPPVNIPRKPLESISSYRRFPNGRNDGICRADRSQLFLQHRHECI